MKREKATAMLVRMVEAIQAGALPAKVRDFHVFGSYVRGSLEPNDVDVVVVHDPPPREYRDAIHESFKARGLSILEQIVRAAKKFDADMRLPLRKPGEKTDIFLTEQLASILGEGSKIPREELICLWSEEDPDYRPKLQALRPDPAAGQAPRDHIISLKRLDDAFTTMEEVVAMLGSQELLLRRLKIDDIDCRLNDSYRHWLEHWTKCKIMGKDALKLLPYSLWWLQSHRQYSALPLQLVIWSESRTHRVHVGRPSLSWMLNIFREFPKVKRQCLIPHFRRDDENELLVFEKGENWRAAEKRWRRERR